MLTGPEFSARFSYQRHQEPGLVLGFVTCFFSSPGTISALLGLKDPREKKKKKSVTADYGLNRAKPDAQLN